MNRMQQKCVVASLGVHLLLPLLLVVGPGFLSSAPKPVDAEPITFVPSIFVDGPPGGGNPKAGQPVAAPPAPPKPPAPAPKAVDPAPPPEPVKPKDTTPDVKSDTKDPEAFSDKPHKPQISLQKVMRKRPRTNTDNADADAAADAQARRDNERRQQIAGLLGHAARDIKAGTGAATTVAGDAGLGGGGPAYASYAAWVLTVYDNAWVAPEDASSEDATVTVKVTIASDGSVMDSRIIQRSGDAAVDASVQRTLDRVSGMGKPFPSTIKDKQRSYIIPFNLKNKRGTA